MKHIFIILLLLLSPMLKAQNQTNASGQKTGKWSGYYESKNLKYIGQFENGKEVGVFTFYKDHPKQEVIATRDYSKSPGKAYAIYYFSGKKMSEGWYIGQNKDGKWTYYHKGGEHINSEEWYVNGKLHGVKKVFFPSGKLSDEIPYVNGNMHGVVKKYTEKGIVIAEENYENGMRNGWVAYYDSNGKLIKKGQFVNDVLQGKWITE